MSITVALSAASALVTAAKTLVDASKTTKEVYDAAKNVGTGLKDSFGSHDGGALSLTAYTKQTTLRSRVYIDGAIADDEVIPKLIKALHTMYAGLIITALQLNQFVTSGKTVKDFVGTVATESLGGNYRNVRSEIANLTVGLESDNTSNSDLEKLLDKLEKSDQTNESKTKTFKNYEDADAELAEAILSDNKNYTYTKEEILKELKRRRDEKIKKLGIQEEVKVSQPSKFTISDVKLAPPDIAPVGKLLEVELTNPDHPDKSAKIMLAVQMIPYIIPTKLASMFINKDTSLSFLQRIIQWRAGEISFLRDLIFQIDRTNKAYEISKNDPDKIFYEFMANVAKKDAASVSKNLSQPNASKSHNLANSVMIFSTDAVAKAKVESGIDLHDKSARTRYFRDTYSMAIAVVDTLYNHVTIYLNGIDEVGTYSFSQFDNNSGSKDGSLDLLKTLAQFTANKAPRFN